MSSLGPSRAIESHVDVYGIRDRPSKGEAIGFALVIILALGTLAVMGTGLGGLGAQHWGWQASILSNIDQTTLIIMITTAGGGGGVIALIVGIVGLVKNYQNNTNALSKKGEDIDTKGNTRYGPEAYQKLGVQVVGEIVPVPKHLEVREKEQDSVFHLPIEHSFPLLYIPEQVLFNGEIIYLTLNTLAKITGMPFQEYFSDIADSKFGDIPLKSGWRRMSMGIIAAESQFESYEQQEERLDRIEGKRRYKMPQALEAVIFMRIVYAFTGKWPYPAGVYTRCVEKIKGRFPIAVGNGIEGNSSGPSIIVDTYVDGFFGVAAVER